MSARELPRNMLDMLQVGQRLDDRALRILTDGRRHETGSIRWALLRNPHMARFTAKELALGATEVHRS